MTFFTALFGLGGITVLICILRRRCFGHAVLTALCGFFALIAVYLICRLISAGIPITPFGIAVSAIGGIPGVILLVFLSTVFAVTL